MPFSNPPRPARSDAPRPRCPRSQQPPALEHALVDPKAAKRSGSSGGSGSGSGSEPGPVPGGGELLRLAAVALTGTQARLLVGCSRGQGACRARLLMGCVLAVNVARSTTTIIDSFITKFNPRLPNDWLESGQAAIGTALFGCAVLLRWKDVMVAYFVRQHIEGLDKGQELVLNFVNPASNIVFNRSRTPHWSIGSASPLLANSRELRWRMKLPHSALGSDKLEELEARMNAALAAVLPADKQLHQSTASINRIHHRVNQPHQPTASTRVNVPPADQVRFSPASLEVVRFTEGGAEMTAKVNLAWRIRGGNRTTELQEKQEAREALMQSALLAMHKVVRGCDGALLAS
ncbi:hypothetical protein TSOC_005651 [Tetrabaena socialis]|uniref:Uncharacterized protein n=1 Tax=Tetrabaena socialis TaxID=47790 RepID=A0A2J8A5R4_9CHLO|nr:hypothetical protein TSOC_005651 [Tetrabaena socialis]|eukprot:PNH07872.1 hypothetical protein TSOC_005651 [Tetrabaena socialis]